jgi:hypothetical protein
MRSGFADLEAVARDAENVWAADASIRAEFSSKETYLAFRMAEARGSCRILGRPMATLAGAEQAAPAIDAEATTRDAERAWAADASVRVEFSSKETYLAFRLADARGAARIIGTRNSAARATPPVAMSGPAAVHSIGSLAERQAQVRQENVGRQFAGLAPLDLPQQ